MLYDFIIQNYHLGEPIFEGDIVLEGMSGADRTKQLDRLVAYAKLMKYDAGIYYIPDETEPKGKSTLCPDVVARNQYIFRRGRRIGYYGGHTLANQMGLSSQVPIKEEFVSNEAGENEEEVLFGKRTYIVRKPPVEVTEDNYRVLQLLEALKDFEECVDESMPVAEAQITYYIKKNKVSKEKVDAYLGYFPSTVRDNIREMRLEHVLA